MKALPCKFVLLAGAAISGFLLLFSIQSFAQTSHSLTGREILALQSLAMAQTSYTGLLTYEHGTHLATIEVNHQVVDGIEHESLIHLNGEPREISRNSDDSRCPHPGELLVRGAHFKGFQLPQDIETYYHISILGAERIAGKQTHMIQVMPRDQHRYGYIVSVDQESFLALKILLIGPGAKVIERFQFSKIDSNNPAPFAAISNELDLGGCSLTSEASTGEWLAHWLPPGFVYAGQKDLSEQRLMLMYTDGLAAFSIFIDTLDAPSRIEGRAQRGATVAYLGRAESARGDYRVTVVGEVPAATLERVALSLRQNPMNESP